MTLPGREWLYLLGFLPTLAFTLRFVIQWLKSETVKKSVVPASFWQISLIGNLLLCLHTFIQVQYHVCLVQACNAIVSWRNLQLQHQKGPIHSRAFVAWLLVITGIGITLLFAAQDYFVLQDGNWFRVPLTPWNKKAQAVSWTWNLLGFAGVVLHSTRFWLQWWEAEKDRASTLKRSFWWMSIYGALLSVIYFVRIGDIVNAIGPTFGLIPYIRNLILLRRNSQQASESI